MANTATKVENTIEAKLRALYDLQKIDSQIDKIKQVRGELPLEVQDLEDELEGLQTRLSKLKEEVKELEKGISDRKQGKEEAKNLIKKYEEQQANVRNNREYDALSKEIEFQNLEIQLCDKRIKEFQASIKVKDEQIKGTDDKFNDRKNDLDIKKKELEEIVAETQKEENDLQERADKDRATVDGRLLSAYERIRGNARNGLAVVNVERDSCGGCFSKIPPQRQMDIKSHKKVIVCESCGRILVDFEVMNILPERPKMRSGATRVEDAGDDE
ncbi:MAG: C4-type zinc ribbon domain-containing protein [Bacteroidota bacterium]